MSTVLIIVIVVVVLVIVGGLLLTRLPKARERARLQKRERELDQRREQVVDERREEAASRERQAEVAEQRARVATQEANKQRAESQLAAEQAKLHERGLADHELINEDERERFAGTSATEPLRDDASSIPGTAGRERTDTADAGEAGEAGYQPGQGEGDAATRLPPDAEDGGELQRPRTTAYEEGQAAEDETSRVGEFEARRGREEPR